VLGARYQPRRFFIGFQASYYHGFTNISKAKSHYYVPGGNYGAAAKKIYNRGVHLGLTYNLPAYFSARKAVTTKHVSAEEARRQEEVRKQRAEAERNKPKKYGIRR
jgi:hypothetical protein